jgi:cytochrome c biogenesis protein CcmG/thiol:disulfide interchange protein DsbE
MSNRGFLAVLAAIAFIGLLAFGIVAKGGEKIAVGEPAPDAPVERLDGSGETSLADHQGQWVLLNFWASWCDPCRDEAPAIERFSREHAGDLVVIGMDTEDLSSDAKAFADEYGLTYELLHDGDGDRKDAYGIFALPESFLIDPDGNLALIQRGLVDRRFLEEKVLPLVVKGDSS